MSTRRLLPKVMPSAAASSAGVKSESSSGSKSKIVHMPLPSDDPQQRKPDITLAHKMLGDWEPTIQLRDGLVKTIAYFEDILSRGSVRH